MENKFNKPKNALPRPSELRPIALKTHKEDPSDLTMNRRDMLKFSALWLTAAYGLAGCDRVPPREIVSRPKLPEYQQPGQAVYYSSTWTEGMHPYGIIVKTVDGRPIRIDGNPDHPLNGGASDAAMQSVMMGLYDPDRLRAPQKGGKEVSWQDADKEIVAALKASKTTVLLTGSNLGPSQRQLVKTFLTTFPNVQHFVYEPIHDGLRRKTWHQIFGKPGELVPNFSKANVVFSLDCDFLQNDGPSLRNVREFAKTRKVTDKNPTMSRLYVAESGMSLTGSNADHRVRVKPSQTLALVDAVHKAVKGDNSALAQFAKDSGASEELLSGLAEDLKANAKAAVVLAGQHLPMSVHAAVCALNRDLEAFDNTLTWNETLATLEVSDTEEITKALSADVDVLVTLGVNPVFSWSGEFSEYVKKAKLSVAHSLYLDETAALCSYALPSNHSLECWNDAVPQDGLYTIAQPVVRNLHNTRQQEDSLLTWLRDEKSPAHMKSWHAFVKNHFQTQRFTENLNEQQWTNALKTGIVGKEGKAGVPIFKQDVIDSLKQETPKAGEGYELVTLPHHSLFDGRYANNPWLQELPDPVNKLVWDNAASVSYATAKKLGVEEGDMISVKVGDRQMELPVLLQKGMADDVIVTTLGHGRKQVGSIGNGKGHNTYQLRDKKSAMSPWIFSSVTASKTSKTYDLVRTQKHFSMEGRPIALDTTLGKFMKDPEYFKKKRHTPHFAQLHTEHDYSAASTEYKWAMAIDLSTCTGCNVCMVACQAENNIHFVGKDECSNGRDMHWIRIDRYEEGDENDPVVYSQPMLCQHCDNAPCETVCPVQATDHSPDGINEMAYNRCVGTRYCANNCPYKVRRFNYYDYRDLRDSVQELAANPRVTVRSRGVMEKCTFCIQRLNDAKFSAKNHDTTVVDGSVKTACQQSCPADCISFGNINDPNSKVSQISKSSRAFYVFEEINVKPNVAYLGKVRNKKEKV